MTLEGILADLKHFDEDWLQEKKKFFELEKGYNRNTNQIEVKWLVQIELLDDGFGNNIVDDQGKPVIGVINDSFYIDFPEYCWDSNFEGALSQNNESVDEDDWIVPIYNLPQDLKTIAGPIVEYLVEGIEKSRHEQVGAVLDKLKGVAIDADDIPEMRRVKTRFYNRIDKQLREKYPFFFDELASLSNNLDRSLSPGICDVICGFTIDQQTFITRQEGDKAIPQGTLLFQILTTPYEKHSHLNATLRCQAWRNSDVYYLIIQIGKYFSGIVPIEVLGQNKKLLLRTGNPLNSGSLSKFKSQELHNYLQRHISRAEQIDGQLARLLKK